MHDLPPVRAARPSFIASVVVLLLLTALGTAPAGDVGSPTDGAEVAVDSDDPRTFADIFQEMRDPEAAGEGRGAVAVAAPAIPDPSNPATPDPAVAAQALAPTVTTVTPSLIVRGVDPGAVAAAAQVPGVAAVASATVGELTVQAPAGPQQVSVAAVDPTAFRPLTPGITAGEPGVWERLVAGDAVFTHDAGNRLAAPLGASVVLGGAGAPTSPSGVGQLRIGALASNGIPPVADAIVSQRTGEALGIQGPTALYVGVADGTDASQVAGALGQATGGQVEEIAPPETQTTTFGAFLVGAEARSFFEPFDYIDHGDGLITIDPAWVSRNIASTTQIPLLNGTVRCHRQMLKQLYAAMSEVEAAGLGPLIDPSQYGGCWVARHIDFNPAKPISMHGWGLAVDMNVSTNQLGARPTMDPRIVEIFDRWGFVWGGRWSRPDGMHFEIGAVIDVPVPEGFFD